MTFGYWFWFGVLCTIGAVALYLLTAKRKPRAVRTVHTVVLFVLLAFGGFKCARDEHVRAELLATAPAAYTIAVTKGDEDGIKFMEDKKRVEAVEYDYTIAGQSITSIGMIRDAYTLERDFYPEDILGRCVLVHTVMGRPEISRLSAVLTRCPETAPAGGWDGIPQELMDIIDTNWWKHDQ